MLYFGGLRGVFSKVVLGFRNLGYDFEGLGEMLKSYAHVNGGPSGASCVQRPWSEDPHRGERNMHIYQVMLSVMLIIKVIC